VSFDKKHHRPGWIGGACVSSLWEATIYEDRKRSSELPLAPPCGGDVTGGDRGGWFSELVGRGNVENHPPLPAGISPARGETGQPHCLRQQPT